MYGPTEATIAISFFKWHADQKTRASGVIPLGIPYPDQKLALRGENGQLIEGPARGELLLGGSQLAEGYWQDNEKTSEKFLTIKSNETTTRWYATGDEAERDENGIFHFCGRLDFQVKIQGYRIELQEIENVLREAGLGFQVVCMAWPSNNPTSIAAFIEGEDFKNIENQLRESCEVKLPNYMRPSHYFYIKSFR